jgi:NDP-sugar pyrophosphorylase family protein
MKAVILSGGLGTRLRPFTEVIPKPLLPIGEKAILEIQIEHLKKYGCEEVFLATNYKSEYIENFFGDGSKYGVKLTISKEDIPLGTAGPVKLLQDKLTEPFIVMNGDILTLLNYGNLYDYATNIDTDLVITTKEFTTPFAFGNIESNGDYVTDIQEKPDIKMNILAGIYVFKPAIFDLIPDNEYFGMDSLIKKMIANNRKIAKYDINEYWLDIGRFDDYQKIQKEYNENF